MNQVTFSINGTEVNAEKGQTILEAALAHDIYIPHLCFHPDLKPGINDSPPSVPHLPVEERANNYAEVEFNISDKAAIKEGERCHKCDTQCRLCLVEIEGMGVTTSCNTPVEQGLTVKTDTPQIEKFRRTCVEAILEIT